MGARGMLRRVLNRLRGEYWSRIRLPALRRSSRLFRMVSWPIPGSEPYRRKQLSFWRQGALGDVLMCTPMLREIKARNPECRITFFTDYVDLLQGLPFIDEVLP